MCLSLLALKITTKELTLCKIAPAKGPIKPTTDIPTQNRLKNKEKVRFCLMVFNVAVDSSLSLGRAVKLLSINAISAASTVISFPSLTEQIL